MGRYIAFKGLGKKEERFYLEDRLIAFQQAIVCREKPCYCAKCDSKGWEHVVIFAWRSDEKQTEGEILKLTKKKGKVWGVAKPIYHQDLEEIADMRSGLQFNKPQTFHSPRRDDINQTHSGQNGMLADALCTSLAFSATSSSRQSKERGQKGRGDFIAAIRMRGNKRPLPASSAAAQMDEAIDHVDKKPKTSSLMAPDVAEDGLYDNRIFSCHLSSGETSLQVHLIVGSLGFPLGPLGTGGPRGNPSEPTITSKNLSRPVPT